MDVSEIKKQAKQIMDSFSEALDKVSVEEARVERDENRREEKENSDSADSDFLDILMENAPSVEGDCIKAEKGKWV